jgi:hypothetical protein
VLHIIERIAYLEVAPDQKGDALGGPHGRFKTMGDRSSGQQVGKPSQLFRRKLRMWPGLREVAKPFFPV